MCLYILYPRVEGRTRLQSHLDDSGQTEAALSTQKGLQLPLWAFTLSHFSTIFCLGEESFTKLASLR